MRPLAWLLVASLSGCSKPSGLPPSLLPPPTATVPAGSIASALPSIEAPPGRPPPPLPTAPPGVDADAVLFTASICAAATLALPGSGKLLVGCRSHPPFDAPDQQPDGALPAFTGDPLRFCALDAVYRGSFTRAGATQAILSFAGCKDNDPDAVWDSGLPGSAVLVERTADRWRAVAYEPSVNLGQCVQPRRADGRDLLLCRSGLTAPPAGTITYVLGLDLARPAKRAGSIARMFGDEFGCAWLPAAAPGAPLLPRGLVSLRITGFHLGEADAGASRDLVVDVERARVPPSTALDTKVAAACKRDPRARASAWIPPATRTRLVFTAAGDGYVATTATRATLDAWQAEAPDGFNGLMEAAPPVSPAGAP